GTRLRGRCARRRPRTGDLIPFWTAGVSPACRPEAGGPSSLPFRLPFATAGGEGCLPMLAVEGAPRLHCRRVVIVEAARVDAVVLGIRARLIERVNAAMPAEGVLRGTRAEGVGRQIVRAAEDFEPLVQNWQVQDALLGADRAVALADHRLREIGLDPEAHAAAMTAALIGAEHAFLHLACGHRSMGIS